MPSRRFDGKEWLETDRWRASLDGQEVIKFMMLWNKGDWAEVCERNGYPTWGSATRPCYCCNASGEDLLSPVGLLSGDTSWESNTEDDYLVACDRCELVIATVAKLSSRLRMRTSLQYGFNSLTATRVLASLFEVTCPVRY